MLTIGLYLLVFTALVNCAALASIGLHVWVAHSRSAARVRSTSVQPNEDDGAWPGYAAHLVTRNSGPVPARRAVPGAMP